MTARVVRVTRSPEVKESCVQKTKKSPKHNKTTKIPQGFCTFLKTGCFFFRQFRDLMLYLDSSSYTLTLESTKVKSVAFIVISPIYV